MKKLFIITLISILIQNASSATTRRVLFLGNSYIYTNNLPSIIQQMAISMGDTLIFDQNTIGGYTLEAHSNDATSINKIYSQAWDIVILQEQSQRPAFDPTQVATDTYPFARKLDSLIRDHRPCTETMFFMTWGYKNGDASNCAFYPPICTYAGMQQRLRESYLQMAQNNNAIVSPVGAAWKQVRDSFPAIDLYSPDESHPAMNGSYLAASVFYASIFHKNPINSSYTGSIATSDAQTMRRIAAKITLDSFNKWNQYGSYSYANFTKSVSGNTVTFTNTSVNAQNYSWNFGDGNTSNTTSPTHTYTTSGKYYITLTASNNCFSETYKDSVLIGTANINPIDIHPVVISNTSENKIFIQNTSTAYNYNITILDVNGRRVISDNLFKNTSKSYELIPGIYLGVFQDRDGIMYKKKIQVY